MKRNFTRRGKKSWWHQTVNPSRRKRCTGSFYCSNCGSVMLEETANMFSVGFLPGLFSILSMSKFLPIREKKIPQILQAISGEINHLRSFSFGRCKESIRTLLGEVSQYFILHSLKLIQSTLIYGSDMIFLFAFPSHSLYLEVCRDLTIKNLFQALKTFCKVLNPASACS